MPSAEVVTKALENGQVWVDAWPKYLSKCGHGCCKVEWSGRNIVSFELLNPGTLTRVDICFTIIGSVQVRKVCEFSCSFAKQRIWDGNRH